MNLNIKNTLCRRYTALMVWLAVAAAWNFPLLAQDMPVPVELQMDYLLKIFTFDRSLENRAKDRLKIGILYQGPVECSLRAKDEMVEAICRRRPEELMGLAVTLVPIDLYRVSLDLAAAQDTFDVFYVTPLAAGNLDTIGRVSREHGILTVTGVPEYSSRGIAVAIGGSGGSPKILINLGTLREEGADFSSQLLKLARIVD